MEIEIGNVICDSIYFPLKTILIRKNSKTIRKNTKKYKKINKKIKNKNKNKKKLIIKKIDLNLIVSYNIL